MSIHLKPYARYKMSGIPWIEKIPENWEVRRNKFVFQYVKELNTLGVNNNVLSLTLRGVVNNDPSNPEGLVPKDYNTYQLFKKDDLVFKLIDLENYRTSRVGFVPEDGIMSPAYIRLSMVSGENTHYFYYQFYDLYLRGVYNKLGAGVRATLGPRDLLDLHLVIPSRNEQDNIVRFLLWLDRRITRLLRAKRRLIELLNEQKQAIIQQAVTRGLDPDAPLKPSGVDWLGDIPEHWEVKRLKFILREVDYRSVTGEEILLSLRMNHGLVPHDEHFQRPGQASTLVGYKLVKPGQVVLNRLQANNGLIFASGITGVVSPDYAVFDPIVDMNLNFLTILLRTQKMRYKIRVECKGLGTGTSGFLRLYTDRFYSIHVSLPSISEQNQIMYELDVYLNKFREMITNVQREIDLLLEYRSRLIADVVTGKLDVRGVELPALDELDFIEEMDINEEDGSRIDEDLEAMTDAAD